VPTLRLTAYNNNVGASDMRILWTALATIGLTGITHAEGMGRFGIGLGRATIEADDFDLEGRATAWEIFGGYEFNPYLAVEAGYIDGGKADDEIAGVVIETDTYALVASVIGSLPVGECCSLYGRAGYMHWESDQEARVAGDVIATLDVDGNEPFFGAGASATVDASLIRLEYRLASLDNSDLSLISLAVVWRF
jgi:OmpA-OmpF porin, OOP family